jgi:hypothetical protein
MKKMYAVVLMMSCAFTSFAEKLSIDNNDCLTLKQADGETCFDEQTHIINVGAGFGSRSYHTLYRGSSSSYLRTPAISLSYEHPFPKKLGPGFLGIGAYLGFQHEYNRYNGSNIVNSNYYYHHTWNHYMVAARAAYHWDFLNKKNAEVYAGAIVGVRIETHSYESNDPGSNDPYSYSQGSVYPAYTVFGGARWYFVKNIALFGEAGYGISYLTGGFSFKF